MGWKIQLIALCLFISIHVPPRSPTPGPDDPAVKATLFGFDTLSWIARRVTQGKRKQNKTLVFQPWSPHLCQGAGVGAWSWSPATFLIITTLPSANGDVLILYKKGRGQTQRGQRFLMLTTSQKQLSRRKTQTYQAAFREGFFRRPCRRGWSLIPLPEGHWVLTKQKLLRWLRGGRCPNGRTARKKEETKQKKHAYDPQPKKKKKVNTRRSIEKVLLR